MPPAKTTLRFVLISCILYAVLMAPWPGLRSGVGSAYRACGNAIFGGMSDRGTISYRVHPEPHENIDTQVVLINRETNKGTKLKSSSRYTIYHRPALVASLVLATPMPWRRKYKALIAGLILTYALILLGQGLWLIEYGSRDAVAIFDTGPTQIAVVRTLNKILVNIPTTHLVFPVLIWAVVAVRRDDWITVEPTAETASGEAR